MKHVILAVVLAMLIHFGENRIMNAPKKHDTPIAEGTGLHYGSGIEHPNTGVARKCYHGGGKGFNMTNYY